MPRQAQPLRVAEHCSEASNETNEAQYLARSLEELTSQGALAVAGLVQVYVHNPHSRLRHPILEISWRFDDAWPSVLARAHNHNSVHALQPSIQPYPSQEPDLYR